ncbi:hypothetical protein F5Y15DRAFT_429876 [Xylariaceae sp. FL0016]|nr:hypothetical protein F5Y15DRAFT_429876 [Xylariaceae sp. FL0016]
MAVIRFSTITLLLAAIASLSAGSPVSAPKASTIPTLMSKAEACGSDIGTSAKPVEGTPLLDKRQATCWCANQAFRMGCICPSFASLGMGWIGMEMF